MKIFIVFTAIMMMGLTCVVYQGDMNMYRHEQETLKMIAEEAACQAALCFDEEAYGRGIKRFDKAEAEKTVASYIQAGKKLLAGGKKYEMTFEISYEDDEHGYNVVAEECLPAVILSVTAKTDDFFSPSVFTGKSNYKKIKI